MLIALEAQPELLPQRTADAIRFMYDGAAHVNSVALAGTFNCWVGDACMLRRESPTRWSCALPLAPGRHLYKFVVDGQQWIPDPANPWISEDGQNNSCLTITETGEVFIRDASIGPESPGVLYERHRALSSPDWLHDAVVYQLSVAAFGGTFDGVRERLGHLAELGVNTIWMMPIHSIGVQGRRGALGDPYAVSDFEAIDPALGDELSLRVLIEAIHARDMRILFDFTLNRSSADHPLTVSHPHWYTRDRNGAVYYAVPNREDFAGFNFENRDLRRYLIGVMLRWVRNFGLDGIRFDDSDITPTDFLDEIRVALAEVNPDIAAISQAYDEFHHLAACDLTYEGGTREMLRRVAHGEAGARAFARYWEQSTYSFPRGALRLRWLEEKEQPRANVFLGREAHLAAASVLLAMDGVPHLLMGQEFGEPTWRDWTVLFEHYRLDWLSFDAETFQHFRALIALRREHAALRRGATGIIDTLPDAVIGFRRILRGETITVLANMSPNAVTMALEPGRMLYARHWIAASQQLGGFGCLIVNCT